MVQKLAIFNLFIFNVKAPGTYIVSKDPDDLTRILKEVCGSSRNLLANAISNNLKSPYTVNKGQILIIKC